MTWARTLFIKVGSLTSCFLTSARTSSTVEAPSLVFSSMAYFLSFMTSSRASSTASSTRASVRVFQPSSLFATSLTSCSTMFFTSGILSVVFFSSSFAVRL